MPVAAVHGLAITGRSVARALVAHGWTVRLSDDRPTDDHRSFADSIGCAFVDISGGDGSAALLDGSDMLVPAPGVPPHNRIIAAAVAAGIPVRSEIDIAYEWEQSRTAGPRPVLGVTGTDGKTTTTMLVSHLLRTAGMRAEEVGNTDIPFMESVDDQGIDAFVVECSSFRLNWATSFRCDSSAWLNLAPDHLDWHPDPDHYMRAKARLWAAARPSDVAVANASDPRILAAARESAARTVTFGLTEGDYRTQDGWLVGPGGRLCTVDSLWRSMPHDITNSLAAAAVVLEAGLVAPGTVASALATFQPAHHRIELVGRFGGNDWYDDSKATSPHAALTAIRAFDRLVLIAGGRNKDLDLSQLASEPGRMSGVVAIGDDAALIRTAFEGICPVRSAGSMDEAVALAAGLASDGDAVVLSPGCTSYDWYRNYNERGDDFQRAVRQLMNGGSGE